MGESNEIPSNASDAPINPGRRRFLQNLPWLTAAGIAATGGFLSGCAETPSRPERPSKIPDKVFDGVVTVEFAGDLRVRREASTGASDISLNIIETINGRSLKEGKKLCIKYPYVCDGDPVYTPPSIQGEKGIEQREWMEVRVKDLYGERDGFISLSQQTRPHVSFDETGRRRKVVSVNEKSVIFSDGSKIATNETNVTFPPLSATK